MNIFEKIAKIIGQYFILNEESGYEIASCYKSIHNNEECRIDLTNVIMKDNNFRFRKSNPNRKWNDQYDQNRYSLNNKKLRWVRFNLNKYNDDIKHISITCDDNECYYRCEEDIYDHKSS